MILGSLETPNTCSKSWYSRWIACLTFQNHHNTPYFSDFSDPRLPQDHRQSRVDPLTKTDFTIVNPGGSDHSINYLQRAVANRRLECKVGRPALRPCPICAYAAHRRTAAVHHLSAWRCACSLTFVSCSISGLLTLIPCAKQGLLQRAPRATNIFKATGPRNAARGKVMHSGSVCGDGWRKRRSDRAGEQVTLHSNR